MAERRFAAMRRLAGALALAGMIFDSPPALALTARDASAVVGLIEALQPEFGQFAYDEEIAADWYERDAADKGLIGSAGFTADSWKVALGETMRGFLATMPVAELDAIFAKLRNAISGMRELTEAQKTETIDAIDEEVEDLMILRTEGDPFADVVRPLTPKIRSLILGPAVGQ
ncbi:hypothetical protein [Mesorhizobium ciceri]|uniref:Uncharacterized protein n=1 Tax=Mesorhizobium ciceri biovar biserrulae (strain HAMBI 2942 / LMG 23838 / WSM1271) TaxID=765698 RepID=E8TFU0_MESCW|nr:hypothetical protein [Mesorhizobium ciceri]ADV09970.1 hypothetical protein Mesci_0802 [Mesorhizobium ciceri biovar biserrulae WSM1271]